MKRKDLEVLGAIVRALRRESRDRYRGTWTNNGTHYAEGDMVTHRGSLWRCKVFACVNMEPGDVLASWQLVVRRGAKGNEGKPADMARLNELIQTVATHDQVMSQNFSAQHERLALLEAVAHEPKAVMSAQWGGEIGQTVADLKTEHANVLHRLDKLESK